MEEGYWLAQWQKMRDERDALRAENEKLHQQRIRLFDERDRMQSALEEIAGFWSTEGKMAQRALANDKRA